jgi:hypothetical protein
MLTTEGGAAVKPSESNHYDCAVWLQLSEILASVIVLSILRVNCNVALSWCLHIDPKCLAQ